MIRKYHSPLPGHVRVVFELPSCLWADKITITGDFNDWDQKITPMRQDRNGIWSATVDLRMGEQYEFRYLIDGQWRTDFHADGYADNEYGTQNSVVVAELPEPEQTLEWQDSLIHEQTIHGGVTLNKPKQMRAPAKQQRSPRKQLVAA